MGALSQLAFVLLHSWLQWNGLWSHIKIKDSAGFKWKWIVSMVVVNAPTPGRTWLLGPIKHTWSANAKMLIDQKAAILWRMGYNGAETRSGSLYAIQMPFQVK